MEKKVWEAPALEVLEVSQTMAGTGVSKVDFTYVNGKLVDLDIYDS
ncbi:paeninodin family lasso peptide [Paenibacillus chartarius]|uniref:Paeninodin family lasso peptide n=1 Tax=Paenibacillus chartarius TaxID=747481 RepID=A0ABV6DKN5_9BACL